MFNDMDKVEKQDLFKGDSKSNPGINNGSMVTTNQCSQK